MLRRHGVWKGAGLGAALALSGLGAVNLLCTCCLRPVEPVEKRAIEILVGGMFRC
jgi:hypothetical protein